MLTEEYYIRRLSTLRFTVAKFDGRTEPTEVYNVSFSSATDTGRCSCPAYRMWGTGSSDKHILMVKKWVFDGEPIPQAFTSHCPFRLPKAASRVIRGIQTVDAHRKVADGRRSVARHYQANTEATLARRHDGNRRKAQRR